MTSIQLFTKDSGTHYICQKESILVKCNLFDIINYYDIYATAIRSANPIINAICKKQNPRHNYIRDILRKCHIRDLMIQIYNNAQTNQLPNSESHIISEEKTIVHLCVPKQYMNKVQTCNDPNDPNNSIVHMWFPKQVMVNNDPTISMVQVSFLKQHMDKILIHTDNANPNKMIHFWFLNPDVVKIGLNTDNTNDLQSSNDRSQISIRKRSIQYDEINEEPSMKRSLFSKE
jgi:hypothetical protein